MFISALTIENYKCFGSETVEGFAVPNGKPGSGLNVLIGENGTGKTAMLEAINLLTDSAYTIENRLSIHDFHDVAHPIEVSYKASDEFRCKMPTSYHGCTFDADGIELAVSPRKQKGSKLLSPPYTVSQKFRPSASTYRKADGTDSRNPVKLDHRSMRRGADWSGDALNVFLFDKNRSRHLSHGTYTTIFERICNDLNWKFVRELNKDPEKRAKLEAALGDDFLSEAKHVAGSGVGEKTANELADFLNDSQYKNLRVDLVNYLNPFETARLTLRGDDSLEQIRAKDLGSGVEVMLAMLMLRSVYGASKGKIVYLVDEPEAHLHPKAQQSLLELLTEESAESQVFLSTHSPYMFKEALAHSPGLFTFTRSSDGVAVENANEVGASLLPWGPTWGELSFRAYGLPTVELHNELYGFIQEQTSSFTESEMEAYLASKGFAKAKNWTRVDGGAPRAPQPVTLSTYVRHSIHHPENTQNADFTPAELTDSVEQLTRLIEGGL